MAYIKQISRGGTTYEINPPSIAGQFSTASNYSAGDYVYYGGYLWRFTADHSAGAWSGTDAEQVTVTDEISRLSPGGGGSGLSNGIKQALLACFENVGWKNGDGSDYIDALEAELYPAVDLASITAVYTQSGTVYDTDTLDSLKADLVVTAHYTDSSSEPVSAYTLSGSLTTGTSTITVSYSGKTTTFTVTVTHNNVPYVSDGLFAYWDAIDNQGTGTHDSSATSWIDLINEYEWVPNKSDGTQTWAWSNGNSLVFNPNKTGNNSVPANCFLCTRPGTGLRTLEVVFTPADLGCCVGEFTTDLTGITDTTVQIIGIAAADDTFIIQGTQNGYNATDITAIKSISGTYSSSYAPVKAYMNGTQVTTQGSSHSYKYHNNASMVLGSQNSTSGYYYAFKGTVHAIRFYSKELSAEEIAQNYAVDVQRFGLGA